MMHFAAVPLPVIFSFSLTEDGNIILDVLGTPSVQENYSKFAT